MVFDSLQFTAQLSPTSQKFSSHVVQVVTSGKHCALMLISHQYCQNERIQADLSSHLDKPQGQTQTVQGSAVQTLTIHQTIFPIVVVVSSDLESAIVNWYVCGTSQRVRRSDLRCRKL